MFACRHEPPPNAPPAAAPPVAESAPQSIRSLWLEGEDMCASSSSGELWRLGEWHHEQSRMRALEPAVAPLHCGRWSCVRTQVDVRCEGGSEYGMPPVDASGRLELPDGHDAIAIETVYPWQYILSASGAIWCRTLPGMGGGSDFERFPLGPARELEFAGGLGCALLDDGSVHCWFDEFLLDSAQAKPELRRPIKLLCEQDFAPEDCAEMVALFRGWTAPVSVADSARDVAVADRVACVLDESGVVRCIDLDMVSRREVALGSAQDFVVIEGLPPLEALAAADDHVCGYSRDGEVWCWGLNSHGQLGDGTTNSSATPRPVRAGTFAGVQSIAVGMGRSCVVARGRALCWGEPIVLIPRPPSRVEGLLASEVRAFEVETCARVDAQWMCWGARWGERFVGAEQQARPIARDIADDQRLIGRTLWHDCFMDDGERLWCVDRDSHAIAYERTKVVDFDFDRDVCVVLADRVECSSLSPTIEMIVFPIAGARAVSGNWADGCVVDREGVAQCWQWSWPHEPRPTPVAGARGLIDVVSATRPAFDAACGLDESKRVLCWGRWETIERGREEPEQSSSHEVRVMQLPPIEQLVGGFGYVCARDEDGGVWCWGHNDDGELGAAFDLRSSATPVQVPGLEAIQLVSGQSHVCALERDGQVTCWGSERYGLRGRVDPDLSLTPAVVKLLP
jgi:hypothetical protein